MTKQRLTLKKSVLALLAIILLTGLLTACMSSEEEEPEANLPAEDFQLTQEISASGEVVPSNWVYLYYPSGATDLEFFVKEGELVEENAILATTNDIRLDTALTQAENALAGAELAYDILMKPAADDAIARARAALANAEANLENQKLYYNSDAVLDAAQADVDAALAALSALEAGPSEEQIAAAELDIKTAQAALAQAQTGFDLIAPFAGTIVEINAKTGEAINAGQPLMILADLNNLQVVTTDLSEIDIARLVVGLRAEILFDAFPEQTFFGTITQIAEKSTGTSSVYYDVVLSLDEVPVGLRWGMTAFIDFPIE